MITVSQILFFYILSNCSSNTVRISLHVPNFESFSYERFQFTEINGSDELRLKYIVLHRIEFALFSHYSSDVCCRCVSVCLVVVIFLVLVLALIIYFCFELFSFEDLIKSKSDRFTVDEDDTEKKIVCVTSDGFRYDVSKSTFYYSNWLWWCCCWWWCYSRQTLFTHQFVCVIARSYS